MLRAQGYSSEKEGQILALSYNGKPLKSFVERNNTILLHF